MSKFTPEVGDVWYILGSKIYITNINNNFVETIKRHYHDCYRDITYRISDLLQEGKYLGKPKVNVEELFDVKD